MYPISTHKTSSTKIIMSTNDSMANFGHVAMHLGFKSENSDIIRLLIITPQNFFLVHTSVENNMTPAEAIGVDILPVDN